MTDSQQADTGVAGLRVVVAGATSESGVAVSTALLAADAQVIAVGSEPDRLAEFARRVPGARTELCDLSDSEAVDALALRLVVDVDGASTGKDGGTGGGIDGLIHLVGGWVGGRGIPGQTDEGWERMERSFRTLRNTTGAFYPALVASPAGRTAFVSSSSVDAPTASGAHYTAAKAASESWMRSVADGFRTENAANVGGGAAATVFVVKALVDDRMRAANPEKTFSGFTDVATLAVATVALWSGTAVDLNGARIRL